MFSNEKQVREHPQSTYVQVGGGGVTPNAYTIYKNYHFPLKKRAQGRGWSKSANFEHAYFMADTFYL